MTTMRFGPFVWPVNPTEIRVEGGRSTREALFPSPSLQEEGEKLSRVTGRGVFARMPRRNSPPCTRFWKPAARRF